MSEQTIEAYPLAWPPGWRRTQNRTRAKFSRKVASRSNFNPEYISISNVQLTIEQGTQRVLGELERFGVTPGNIIISSNLQLRNDGMPRSGQRQPDDPGIAVYWQHRGQRRCMAIDRYDRVADNLAAIAATLSAMRAIERHGGATILDRAFTGFTALPSPEQPWQVLGLSTSKPTIEQVSEAYRRLAARHHSDRGGSDSEMARINVARDLLLKQLAGE